MRQFILAALLVLSLFSPAYAQTAEERQRLDWAAQRGRLLFEIDRAAWVTTDDLREHLPRGAREAVRGWTVEQDGAGYVVVYFMPGEGETRRVLYRARVENRHVVSRETFRPHAGPELTPMQRRIAAARSLLEQTNAGLCANTHPNIAVIPPDSLDGPMDVYVLTPQTTAGTYPFGGHNRATFSATGQLLSQRAFTNSCLDMSEPARGAGRPGALMVTHLLDPIPTEIHVFLAIWIGLPVYVGAGGRIWEVTESAIRFVGNIEERPGT